jgi:nucleotide-binding universal stress UspA family protein
MTILIPTDFSENAFKAIDFVYSHFKADKIIVKILHSISQPVSTAGVMLRLDDMMKLDAQRDMLILAKKIKELYGDEPETIIKHGHLKDAVNQISALTSPDLIVMGTKGESDIKSRLMGSVTEAIIRTSMYPILAIPVTWYKDNLHNISITTAKNELESKPFLSSLIESLNLSNPRFDVLTVLGKKHQGGLPRSMDLNGLQFNVQCIENESVVNGINNYLELNKVDLLAMYHSHNSRLDYLFNRSITKTICAHVEVPLLVIPAHG